MCEEINSNLAMFKLHQALVIDIKKYRTTIMWIFVVDKLLVKLIKPEDVNVIVDIFIMTRVTI